MIKFLVAVVFSFSFYGCSNKATFRIDNPTDQEISVVLDHEKLQVPAMSGTDVALSDGQHELQYLENKIKFNLIVHSNGFKGGIINPTLSNYYSAYEIYSNTKNEQTIDSWMRSLTDSFSIDGYRIVGTFKKTRDLVIDNALYECEFGVESPFPQEVMSNTSGIDVQKRGKFFREKDFVAYLAAEYEFHLDGERNAELDAPLSLAEIKNDMTYNTYQFGCEQMDQYVQQLNQNAKIVVSSSKMSEINDALDFLRNANIGLTEAQTKGNCLEGASNEKVRTYSDQRNLITDWARPFWIRSVYIVNN